MKWFKRFPGVQWLAGGMAIEEKLASTLKWWRG